MPLSSRIIKTTAADVKEGEGFVIDTILDEWDSDEEIEDSLPQEVAEAQRRKKKIVLDAEEQAAEILEQARIEAEELKAQAKEQGYQEGLNLGNQQGFQEGYVQAQNEAEEIKRQARQMISDAQLEIEEYLKEKRESILSLSVHMAENIIQEHLALAPEGILELVHPILHQLDREEDFVSLTVHPSLKDMIQEHLPQLKETYTGIRFAVLSDESLEQSGCLVESAHKVVDLQVKKQLLQMIEEWNQMERDV